MGCNCNKGNRRPGPTQRQRALRPSTTRETNQKRITSAASRQLFQSPLSPQTRSQRTRIEKLRADAIKRTFGK